MMKILWIAAAACAVIELILSALKLNGSRVKREKLKKNLCKLIEDRVLDHSLKHRVTSGQATLEETQMVFLYIEFLNTKPMITYLYALDEWITIGRSKENKVCIHNDQFSRLHCKIGYVNGRLVLMDLGSVNGAVIKRGWFKKISVGYGGQAVLESKDIIVIGQYKIKIQIVKGSDVVN